jgi:aryl-alcohol dehydrogenase-like predicted oxidoreductase
MMMRYLNIPGLERPVSRIALGAINFTPDNPEPAFAILDEFIGLGGTLVDTAHIYRSGGVDRTLGLYFDAKGRDRVMVLGKGCHPIGNSGPRVTPEFITSDLSDSLERMHTDYIDLYILHRDDENVPVGPIVERLNEERAKGRIRAFGGSNWSHRRIREANEYAEQHGLVPFAASNPNLSLARPNEPMWAGCISADDEMRAWHKQTQLPLISWSSQAGGFFTGRFSPEDRSNADMVRVYYSDANWERLRRATELAEKRGVTPVQIALAYVLSQPFPTVALIGPQNSAELASSYQGSLLELTDEELAYLDAVKD